jgi:hypothetical protein
LKVANKFLYSPGIFDLLKLIESTYDLKFIGFSRIDIAHDFNYFSGCLDPELFIKKVANEKFIKKGLANYKFIAKNRSRLVYEYMRIGSDKSDLVGYLYNKTSELDQVKNKPYIRETWDRNALEVNKDVWRLEFSIKGNSWQIIDKISGENLSHTTAMLKNTDLLIQIYSYCVDRIFTFYYNENKIRKDRNEKVVLFNYFKNAILLEKWCELEDSTRGDRILINKLLSTWDELRQVEKGTGMLYYNTAYSHAVKRDLLPYLIKKESKLNEILKTHENIEN